MTITHKEIHDYLRCPTLFSNVKEQRNIADIPDLEKEFLVDIACQELWLPKPLKQVRIADASVLKASYDDKRSFALPKIMSENFSCQPDLLNLFPDGRCDLYQIIPSFHVRSEEINYLAMASLLLKEHGIQVKNHFCLLINPRYEKGQKRPFYKSVTVNNKTKNRIKKIQKVMSVIKTKSRKDREPVLDRCCYKPKPCQFFEKCWPAGDEMQVLELAHLPLNKKIQYVQNGVSTVGALEEKGIALTDVQKQQKRVEESQSAYINKEEVKHFFDSLVFPVQCFDIEVAQMVFPLYQTQGPFAKVPFLYSVHVSEDSFENAKHHSQLFAPISYADTQKESCFLDYKRKVAEALIRDLSAETSIIVFDAALEKQILDELIETLPDLSEKLTAIKEAIRDISPLFIHHHVVLPGMRGRSSIKSIVPCIVSSTSYSDLSVQSGFDLVQVFKKWLFTGTQETDDAVTMMQEYCETDTVALVDILRFLKERS